MKYLIIIVTICISINAFAQNKIIYKGLIVYNRKVNVHAQMDKYGSDNEWTQNMKKNIPKFRNTNFDLLFNMQKSLYQKSKVQTETAPTNNFWGGDQPENITYKNIDSNKIITQMNVFDKNFLLQDTLPKYQWKITNEYKTICGYNCRRATAIIMDSLYVIAFYTDAIYPSTGPLGTNGLPGAILGLVVPRLNTSYFATKVDGTFTLSDDEITPATKGEKINSKGIAPKIKEVTKSWGEDKYFMTTLWGILL